VQNGIDIQTITLNRYDPVAGEWTPLPTTFLSDDNTYAYFSAISPGLSVFGITGQAPTTTSTTTTTTTPTTTTTATPPAPPKPFPLELAVLIAGIAIIAIIVILGLLGKRFP